jgi:PKD repeat protein
MERTWILILVSLIALQAAVAVCYDDISGLPATCSGTITSDVTLGTCRTLECSLGSGSVRALACEKTGSPKYFEIYRQASTGTAPEVCLAGECLKSGWGYERGADFPVCTTNTCVPTAEVCDQSDNDCDGQIDEGSVCIPPPTNGTCYAKVNDVPVTCTGGTVTRDDKGGCRTIICSNGGSSMQALACDKPSSTNPTYFEVYKQTKVGTAVSKICFGNACVDGKGYARSNLPYCTASNVTNGTSNVNVTIRIVPGFPSGPNYAFQCVANGFTPNNYTFNFGDGTSKTVPVYDVFHTYNGNGTYTVTCSATNGTMTKSASVLAPLTYTSWEPVAWVTYRQINSTAANLTCNSDGFRADIFTFTTPSGPREGGSRNTITHNFGSPGEYNVSCTAHETTPEATSTYYNHESWAYHSYSHCAGMPYGTCYSVSSQDVRVTLAQGNQTNQTPPNTTTCFNSLNTLPANCTGTITSDVKDGCRTIQCSASNGNVRVLSCEKTDSTGKFFEIYKQSSSGTPPTVCIGKDCLRPGWGYERGDYFPVCMGTTNATQPPVTCTYNNQTYQVNQTFPEGDGCNTCTCTSAGIVCTQQACTDVDPGANSTLSLASGVVNGQAVFSSQRIVRVFPGGKINGTINLAYNNAWPDDASTPLGGTSNWANAPIAFRSYGNAEGTGKAVTLNFTAPVYQGDYAIIFAYRAETTPEHVFSMTNWAYGNPVWYDGNDISQWSAAIIRAANNIGRTNGSVLFTDGMKQQAVPATALIIRVTTEPINTTQTGIATVLLNSEISYEHNALFQCLTNFTPAEFRWDFGDGQTRVKNATTVDSTGNWNYYHHSYLNNGTYTVTCTAINGSQVAVGSTTVNITTEATAAEIAATLPADDTDWYNPFITRLVQRQVNGSTFDFGSYAVGLPRNSDGSGQGGYWLWSMQFYNQLTGTHGNIVRITFPEPGNYTYGNAAAGRSWPNFAPEEYNAGGQKRGCSNPRTICYRSNEVSGTVVVPELGTRTEYGILTRPGVNGMTEISCQSYATDAGNDGMLIVDNVWTNGSMFIGNQWSSFNLSPGAHAVVCRQEVGAGQEKRYERTINVTGQPQSNASVSLSIAPFYPQGRDYVFTCDADFNATLYDYDFNDGDSWTNETFSSTFHAFDPGNYTVSCTAKNDVISRSDSMTIEVQ